MEINKNKLKSGIHSKKAAKHLIRDILCVLLSFLLSIALVGLSLLVVIQYNCFQESAILRALSSSNYYTNNYIELINRVSAIIQPSGAPAELAQEVFQEDDLEDDMITYIDAQFQNGVAMKGNDAIRARLKDSLNTFLEQHNGESGLELEDQINDYVGLLLEQYQGAIKLPLLDYFMKIRKEYQIIHFLGVTLCVSMIILILILLIRLNGWLHRSFRYVAYSTLASALMLGFAPSILLMYQSYREMQISQELYNRFLMNYITDAIGLCLIISVCYLAVSIIIILTGKGIKANLIKFHGLSKG